MLRRRQPLTIQHPSTPPWRGRQATPRTRQRVSGDGNYPLPATITTAQILTNTFLTFQFPVQLFYATTSLPPRRLTPIYTRGTEGDATGSPQVSQVTGSPQVSYPEDSRWGQKQQQASPKTAANMCANNGASETTAASAPPSHAPQVEFPPGVQSKWGRTASAGGQGRNAPYVGAARAEGDDGGRGGSGRGGSSSGGGASNSGGMRPPEPTTARAGALPPPIPPATAINMTEVDTTPDEDMQRMMEKSDEGPGVIGQSVQLVTAFPLSVAWHFAKFILAIANPGAAMRQISRRRKKRRALAKKARRMIKERLNLDIRRPADSARLSERLAEARSRQSFGEKISWEVSEIVFDDQASVIRAALELIELEEFENAALESGQQDAGGGTNAINSASSGGGGGGEPGETTSKARRSSSSTGWFGRKSGASNASNGAEDSSSEGAIEGPLYDDTGAGDREASSAQGNGGWLGLLQRPAKLLRSIGTPTLPPPPPDPSPEPNLHGVLAAAINTHRHSLPSAQLTVLFPNRTVYRELFGDRD